MAHTPAPWLYKGQTVYAVNDQNENRFFTFMQGGWLHRQQPYGEGERTTPEELLANAALIAAAPDLLAMAKLLEASMLYEINKSQHEGDAEGARRKRVTLHLVRAAIAKATGEA